MLPSSRISYSIAIFSNRCIGTLLFGTQTLPPKDRLIPGSPTAKRKYHSEFLYLSPLSL